MTLLVTTLHPAVAMLALFQGTQLNLFERFLTQALSGIDSTSITSGMQNVAYIVLLVGFLWQVYQSALHGGDVRGLGTSLIKYVATAFVIMNYSAVFSTVNQGFVNAGNWIGNASGAGNLFDNWKNDIQTQFNQDASQQLWALISGGLPGLIDGLLIIVAYILYPVVIAIFGFFYIFYGSVLYIFGPIVIALFPHPAGSRIAKSYIENVFIWNAWPILYGGFGALLSAVQMGQVGQMLNQNDFLGALGNVEGSFLIGIASIIYSLAIGVIPFIAKRIVSGDVGATAAALVGAAATALTAGAAAIEGVGVGLAAGGSGTAGVASTSPATAQSGTSGARATAAASGNQPAPSQRGPDSSPTQLGNNPAPSSASQSSTPSSPQGTQSGVGFGDPIASSSNGGTFPTAEAHADFMRGNLAAAFSEEASGDEASSTGGEAQSGSSFGQTAARTGSTGGRSQPSSSGRRPSRPTVRRYDVGTWGAFHAARLATQAVVGGGRAAAGAISSAADSISNPVETAGRIGASAGRVAGTVANTASSVGRTASSVARAVSNPGQSTQKGKQAVSDAVTGAAHRVAGSARQTLDAATIQFSEGYGAERSRNDANSDRANEE
jgi:hypothetical protein